MKIRLFHAMLSAVMMLGVPVAQRADADAFTYSTVRRPVRAGVLVSRAINVSTPAGPRPENTGTHIFYILDRRTDLKPFGMEFLNPLAPQVITPDIYQRWRERVRNNGYDPAFDNAHPLSRVFRVGARITKNMGAYWEVNLDNVSAEDLKQYDLLYLHSHRSNAMFSAELREKLRKFVEGGGTLWVENSGGMTFAPASPFLFDVQFNNGANGNAGAVIASTNHPLLSSPYVLTPQEIQNSGDKRVNDFYVYQPESPSNPAAPGPDNLNPPGALTLTPVVWNTRGLPPISQVAPNPGWRPYILAGQVGAGRLVFSCQDSGDAINNYVGGWNAGYGGNTAAISGENLQAARPTDLKFAYNLAAWSAAHTTPQTDVRRSGGTSEKIGARLVDKWGFPAGPGTSKVSGAVFYKNALFAVDGELFLHCYDASPAQDLDGNGNPDDGVPDYIRGLPYDEIWRIDLKQFGGAVNGASAPTVIEFYDPDFVNQPAPGGLVNFNQRELVVVVLSDGTVVGVRAFPRAAAPGFPLAPATVADWSRRHSNAIDYGIDATPYNGTVDPNPARDRPIPAAAWSEGVLFVSLNTGDGGRIAALDPRTGGSALNPTQPLDQVSVPDAAGIPPILSAPTVGYVRDRASGAHDKIVYAYVQRLQQGGASTTPDSIRGFWFSTKGEPLTRLTNTVFSSRSPVAWYGTDGLATVHNAFQRPRVFLSFRDPATGEVLSRELEWVDSNPQDNQFSLAYAAGQGMRITIGQNVQAPGGPVVSPSDERCTFYADYTLEWGPQTDPARPKVNARTVFNAPDILGGAGPAGGTVIGGSPMLSPEDNVYYTATTDTGTTNSGRGVLFGVNEQSGGRTMLKWAFTMHDGFTFTLGTQTLTIPPRLRQMDPLVALYTGSQVGDFLSNVQFFGTPAYRNGVVYAVARAQIGNAGGAPVSVLCAFRADPELRLVVPIKGNTTTDPQLAQPQVRIWQVNIVNSQNVTIDPSQNASPNRVELSPAQYTAEYDSINSVLNVRIHALAPIGTVTNFFSTSLPWIVEMAGAEPVAVYGTQVDLLPGGERQTRIIGPPGIDNLLWYAVLPAASNNPAFPAAGYVASSPSVQGDTLWLGTQFGYLLSFDADPSAHDPAAHAAGGQVFLADADGEMHLRWAQRVGAGPVLSPPAGVSNVLAANTYSGVQTYEDTFTIIADNKRLVEVNAAGDAVWTSDGTRSSGIAGGDLPGFNVDANGDVIIVNPQNATGVPVVHKVPFARPRVARRIGLNDLLVVDSGNNRIAQIDRGGNIVWEVNRLFDDFKRVLRPGDPLSLNEPSDCAYWTEFNPNLTLQTNIDGTVYSFNGPAFIVHYLIADTGNFRIIELVDVYDAAGRPVRLMAGGTPAPFTMLRQVNFVSSTYGTQGQRYRYITAERIMTYLDRQGQPLQQPRPLTVGAVSNYRLVGSGPVAVNAVGDITTTGGGSLVVLDENGVPESIVSNLLIPRVANPIGLQDYRIQPISNPAWFSRFEEVIGNQVVFKYLLADDNGCYQLRTDPNNPQVMVVEWMLTNQDYYLMTGKRLRAACIRRLNAAVTQGQNTGLHRFLITNRFSGGDNPAVFGIVYNTTGNPANGNIQGPSEFHGEVFELDPTTFTFDPNVAAHGYAPDYLVQGNFLVPNPNPSIVWRAPREQVPTPGAQIGFIRRFIGDPNRATSTAILEQPSFADRPF